MTLKRKGFTLIELMVVVVILGTLATIGVPAYRKSVETGRAGDAQGPPATIVAANKMYRADRAAYCCTTGLLSSSNELVSANYIADVGWAQLPYTFYACTNTSSGDCCSVASGSPSLQTIACAHRRTGFGTYSNWIYRINTAGACTPEGAGAPGCIGM